MSLFVFMRSNMEGDRKVLIAYGRHQFLPTYCFVMIFFVWI